MKSLSQLFYQILRGFARISVILMMTAVLFALSACSEKQSGGRSAAGDTSESKSDAQDPNAPYELEYIDAYGEHHTATIDPTLKQHPYDWSHLKRKGDVLAYDGDASYTIRRGIDVSTHQGEIDWKAVKNAGRDFVFVRAAFRAYGETGKLFEDERARKNLKDAAAAGLDTGVYVFSQAVSEKEALEEAELVLNVIKDAKLTLPVVFDPEKIRNDTARTDHVSGEQFTKNTLAFCRKIREAGYEPMVYANMVWEADLYDMKQLQDLPVWYADYEPTPQTPYDFRFWQYSEKGTVPGINGKVDLDVEFIKN